MMASPATQSVQVDETLELSNHAKLGDTFIRLDNQLLTVMVCFHCLILPIGHQEQECVAEHDFLP